MTKSGSENGIATYEYDLNNRLTKETNADNTGIHTTQYTCDHNGNQVLKYYWSLTSPSGGTPSVFLQPGGGLDTFVYDGLNRLIAVEVGGVQAEYTYKTDGLRISKTVGGNTTRHIWDGANISAETDDTGAVIAVYVRGVNLILAVDNNGVNYYLFNAHGDVVQLADSNGVVVKTYKYDAFGVEWNPSSSDANPFRYCGEYWDGETGNYYLRARYYDPAVGRFITADTHWNVGNMIYGDDPESHGFGVATEIQQIIAHMFIRQAVIARVINEIYATPCLSSENKITNALRWSLGQLTSEEQQALEREIKSFRSISLEAIIQSGNLYVYCANNPIKHIDPSGNWFWVVVGAAAGGITAYNIGKADGLNGNALALFTTVGAALGALVGNSLTPLLKPLAHIFLNISAGTFKAIGFVSQIGGFKLMMHGDHHEKGIHVVLQRLVNGVWQTIFEKGFK